jgi:FAD/FMN-containing dehydrogenase
MVRAGVVIDSRPLSKIERVSARGAVVEAGARWSDVLRAALAQGLTPPVLTDYIELSVGGTLSVGGIGGHTQHHGLQADNVLELDVVTGKGELVTCSETQRRALFDAVLGGLGQFGIIVRATLKLVPAATHARAYQLYYTELGAFLRDQRAALDDGRFDYLEGQVIVMPGQSPSYMLEAAAYYTPPEAPDDAVLLAGLAPAPARTQIQEYTYFDWQNRLAPAVEFFESTGQWSHPHPFFDLFLPERGAQAYVADVLAQLTLFDMGGGPILLYPFHRAALKRPFSIMPASDIVYLFDLLRFAPPDAISARDLVARNRALYDRARPLGAKRYPISAVHFRFPDWADHFGSVFERFSAAKAEFDPRHILGSGQGIFPGPRPSEEAEWAETQ